jgi:CBS domain-containing protein
MFENRITVLNYFNEVSNSMKVPFSSPVITVEPDASIHDALVQMQTNFIKRVVIAAKNKPLGIITERDISKYLEEDETAKALDEIPVKYVMKKQAIVLSDGIEDKLWRLFKLVQ